MTKRRDAAYYEGRLKRDYPKEFAELRAGRFKSVRQAAAAAGLIHLPTRLDALKREWNRAVKDERVDFLAWVRASLLGAKRAIAPAKRPIIDGAGHLKPAVIKFISDWTVSKRVRPGKIMKEIGFSNYDATLAFVILPLERWLARNGF